MAELPREPCLASRGHGVQPLDSHTKIALVSDGIRVRVTEYRDHIVDGDPCLGVGQSIVTTGADGP